MKFQVVLSLLMFAGIARPDTPQLPPQLREIGIEQRLGAQLPLDAQFRDESGQVVRLGSFFHGRPVLLALVYYECPMLCNRILSGVVEGLRPLRLKAGRDFEVVAISINPRETPAEAAEKRDLYTDRYAGRGRYTGWHFLVGEPDSIKAVTESAGFHYRWDPQTNMFIHGSGIMIVRPDGVLSRYFYGVQYVPNDLNLGLIESSKGAIGSPVDKILLFCYHYDPATGKYGAVVMRILRAAGVLTVFVMAFALWWLCRHDRTRVPQGS